MENLFVDPIELILSFILIASSIGVVYFKKPVHSALSFLLTLLMLAALYLEIGASFIAVLQILVYAGAILVLFMFVMMIFQNAIPAIEKIKAKSSPFLILIASLLFSIGLLVLGRKLFVIEHSPATVKDTFGTVEELGKALYLKFFFPFEAIILVFLIAIVGTLYIGKKE